ncbi:MAG: exo-alpha-sialidase [Opitutus sp.]|nr:exo-alpha-sialidase [Opitutus sp.]
MPITVTLLSRSFVVGLASITLALGCGPRALAAQILAPLHGPSVVWERDTEGYNIFKVPTLVTDRERKILLAISEGRVDSRADDAEIHLVLRRSADAGRTWSKTSVIHKSGKHTVGNPAPVVDRETGGIWLFFSVDNRELWLTSTPDAGLTWAAPQNLTATLRHPEQSGFIATGPGHGIQLERGARKGRLLVTGYGGQKAVPPHTSGSKSFAIVSDDHGKSWRMGVVTQESQPGGPDGNECMAAELNDGRLYLTIRNNLTLAGRAYAVSDSAGDRWSPVRTTTSLPEPVCEMSVISYPISAGKVIQFCTGPSASARGRKDKSARRDVAVWLSQDDGQRWEKQLQLWDGPSAYSDMAVLADGTLCVIFEAGKTRYDDQIVLKAFRVDGR